MNNNFNLWSPPMIELSLDSFSNDLINEFDKARNSLVQSTTEEDENIQKQVMNMLSCVSSASTLPVAREEDESDIDTVEQLSIKKAPSPTERHSTATEDIPDLLTRLYPPKPLQYTPVIAPIRMSSETSNSNIRESAIHTVETSSTIACDASGDALLCPRMQTNHSIHNLSPYKEQTTSRKVSPPEIPALDNKTSSSFPGSTGRRWSIFSLRFCQS